MIYVSYTLFMHFFCLQLAASLVPDRFHNPLPFTFKYLRVLPKVTVSAAAVNCQHRNTMDDTT